MIDIAGGILLALLVIYGLGFAVLAWVNRLFREEKQQAEPAAPTFTRERYPTPDPH